jgi:general stress protein 26
MTAQAHDDVAQRLWREIDKVKIGMLGLSGDPPRHMQPMTAFCDEGGGPIWFYTRNDTDLARETGAGHAAMFCLMSKDHEFIACIAGRLALDHDRERIDRFWNPVAGAWFPEGKDDPALTMLRFDPEDAQVWLSRANPVRFGFEVAKANLTRSPPDVGSREHLRL